MKMITTKFLLIDKIMFQKFPFNVELTIEQVHTQNRFYKLVYELHFFLFADYGGDDYEMKFIIFTFFLHVQNYGSLDSVEPSKVIMKNDHSVIDAALISEIDRTMKKHADNLMHALEGVSARISQLESRSRNLENSVDDLRTSVGNNHGNTDGKLRQIENIIREVNQSHYTLYSSTLFDIHGTVFLLTV